MAGSGGSGRRRSRRGWDGGLWFDFDDVHWFPPERGRGRTGAQALASAGAQALAAAFPAPPLFVTVGPAAAAAALPAPQAFHPPARPRRSPGWSAERKRRFTTRFVPTATLAITAAAAAPWLLQGRAAPPLPLPPLPVEVEASRAAAAPSPAAVASILGADSAALQVPAPAAAAPAADPAAEPAAPAPYPEIVWRESRSIGVPHAGRLEDGVRLPLKGPDWVTWDPALKQSPNRAVRLYGTDRLVRTLLTVIEEYRVAHPNAPRVVVGDLSRRGGGPIDQHVSHENGLDVDVYYPRKDGRLWPPARVEQINLRLAQDLVDRFVAAGAQVIFVGPNTPLRGPAGVVVPYPNHDNHLHVRLPAAG